MVPWKEGGVRRVVVLGLSRAGSVMWLGGARGRVRSHCSAELASDSVALLVGLAW
jgi:hypothetical protein